MLIGTNSKKLDISQEKKTKELSERFSKLLNKGDIVFLFGEIGTGKTTFIKYLINHLQKKSNEEITEIPSPTFNILHEYKVKDLKILHYDLYRVKDENELENLGQILDQENALTFVEWPDLLKNNTSNLISLIFKYEDNLNKRSLIISSENNKINDEFK